MSIVRSAILALTGVVALSLMVPGVLAHGDEAGGMDMGVGEAGGMGGMMNMSTPDAKPDESSYPPTYFAHPEHQGLLWAHIVVMAIGWIIVLPVGKISHPLRRIRDFLLGGGGGGRSRETSPAGLGAF